MKRRLASALCAAAACALALLLPACQPAAPPNTSTTNTANTAATPAASPTAEAVRKAPTDLEQLAQRLVTQSAAVKEGEVVFISGRSQDAELLENIAVNVRKVGGFPLVQYASDRLAKRMFFDVPEQYDAQQNALGMKLAGVINVTIDVSNGLTENLLEGADPKRQAARGKANESVGQEYLKRNVRTVEIGNGFYPTSWRAKRFE
ncbi:MAG: aminopeptidase, partial [Acidobacteria bacterium]|nr:aminopeptidase [Acidobacteriota bacterium]